MLPYLCLLCAMVALWRLELLLVARETRARGHEAEEKEHRDAARGLQGRRLALEEKALDLQEVRDVAQRDREDQRDQMADERRTERLRLKERDIALRERIHAPSVEPPPMPQGLLDWSLTWGDGWAQDDALKRARELYHELGDWDAVFRAVQKQRVPIQGATVNRQGMSRGDGAMM